MMLQLVGDQYWLLVDRRDGDARYKIWASSPRAAAEFFASQYNYGRSEVVVAVRRFAKKTGSRVRGGLFEEYRIEIADPTPHVVPFPDVTIHGDDEDRTVGDPRMSGKNPTPISVHPHETTKTIEIDFADALPGEPALFMKKSTALAFARAILKVCEEI